MACIISVLFAVIRISRHLGCNASISFQQKLTCILENYINRNNLSHTKQRNGRWLLRIKVLCLGLFLSACSETPVSQTSEMTIPPDSTVQQPVKSFGSPLPTDVLMAQVKPPNSCVEMMENLHFAAESGLLFRDGFFNQQNIMKLLVVGDSTKFEDVWKSSNLYMLIDNYKVNKKALPCSDLINIRYVSGEYIELEGQLGELVLNRKDKNFDQYYKRINIDTIIDVFKLKKLDYLDRSPIRYESLLRRFSRPRLPHHGEKFDKKAFEERLERERKKFHELIEQIEINTIPHPLGRSRIIYRKENNVFGVQFDLFTYQDGSINKFFITIKRSK